MRQKFLLYPVCAAAAVLGACASAYTDAARATPIDPRSRLELRILEARESAAAAERVLAGTPSADARTRLAGESLADQIDECRWELERRIESVRDVAARLPDADPSIALILESFDRARADLDATRPDNPASTDRALASLSRALDSADGFTSAPPPSGPIARVVEPR